jgi:capsular polysaccharide biosynthesis protein
MNEKEISIIDLLGMVFSNKILIAVLAVIMGFSTFVYSSFFVEPTYVAKGTLYVTIDNRYSAQANVNINDIMAAQELTNTYIEILSSNTFFKKVSEECGLDYTYKEIKSMVSYGAKDESEIIQMAVTSYNPEHSAIIADTILRNAPTVIKEIVIGGWVKVIDRPEIPAGPSSPNIPKNCVVAVLLGVIIACAINFIKSYFDDSIKNVASLSEKFNIPVLAEIPIYDQSSVKTATK